MVIKSVFGWILNTSVMAAALTIIILLVKLVFRNKISAKWHYALWLPLVIRLLAPFSIPMPFGFYNSPDIAAALDQKAVAPDTQIAASSGNQQAAPQGAVELQRNSNSGSDAISPMTTPLPGTTQSAAGESRIPESNVPLPSPIAVTGFNIFSYDSLAYLWLLGAIVMILCTIASNLKLYFSINRYPSAADNRILEIVRSCAGKMGVRKTIPAVLAPDGAGPSLFGIVRPKLLFPKNLINSLKDEDLKYVTMHELSHYKRKDILLNWLLSLLHVIHWFNPFIWLAFNRMREDCEIAADARAMSFMDPAERKQYGHSLLNITEYLSKVKWLSAVSGFSAGKSGMKRRINMIRLFNRKSSKWSLIALALIIFIGTVGLANGCGREKAAVNDTSSPAQTSGQEAVNANPTENSPSAAPPTSGTPAAQPQIIPLKGGDVISVQGDSYRRVLQSADFIDQNNGWLISNSFPDQNDSDILRSQDGGITWSVTPVSGAVAEKLYFADKSAGWVIARSGTGNSVNDSVHMKILGTRDGGQSWNVQWESDTNASSGYDLWFQDSSKGFVLMGGILLSTTDCGKGWEPVSFGIDAFVPQHMSFATPETGWVTGSLGSGDASDQNSGSKLLVLKTSDGGKTWRQQLDLASPDGPAGSIGIDFINAETGWFLTSNMATWEGDLYYTSNGGQDWEKINRIKCVRPTPTELKFISPKDGWIPLDVGAGPIGGGFMVTHDGGKSFENIGNNDDSMSAHDIDFISQEQGWAIGTNLSYGDYLIRTNDGGRTWAQIYPETEPVKDISFVDENTGFGIGTLFSSEAFLFTADGGTAWNVASIFNKGFHPEMVSFIDASTGWVLGVSSDSYDTVAYKTTDGGNTWEMSDSAGLSGLIGSAISYFRFSDADNGIIAAHAADGYKIFRTSDGGVSWQASALDQNKGDTCFFSFISKDEGWVAIRDQNSANAVTLKKTVNGTDWQTVKEFPQDMWVTGMWFTSRDKGFMLVTEPPFRTDSILKLLATNDGGVSWSEHLFSGNPLPDTTENQMPSEFTDDLHGWILTAQGLYKTIDGGKTWVR